MHYEDFITGMTDAQYDAFIDQEATDKQREIALRIREEEDETSPEVQEAVTPTERRQNRILEALRRFLFRQWHIVNKLL